MATFFGELSVRVRPDFTEISSLSAFSTRKNAVRLSNHYRSGTRNTPPSESSTVSDLGCTLAMVNVNVEPFAQCRFDGQLPAVAAREVLHEAARPSPDPSSFLVP
mgnify:CR=1 FL=1